MLDLHYLKLFHVVAQTENFTKASEILHMTQPALSIQIKKLEEGLALKLFNKNGNKIQLNANGTLLKAYTDQIFQLVDEVAQKLVDENQLIRGEINIGGSNTPGTYILPQIIGHFKAKYPDVKINLKIGTTEEITHLIHTGTIDIAINGGELIYGSIIGSRKLMEDDIILAAGKSCALQGTVTKDDLEKVEFIVHSINSQLYKVMKDFFDTFQLSHESTMAFNSIDAIKQAVTAHLGLALIPSVALQLELEIGSIRQLNTGDKKWVYPYYLIWNKQRYLSPATKMFIAFIDDYFELNTELGN